MSDSTNAARSEEIEKQAEIFVRLLLGQYKKVIVTDQDDMDCKICGHGNVKFLYKSNCQWCDACGSYSDGESWQAAANSTEGFEWNMSNYSPIRTSEANAARIIDAVTELERERRQLWTDTFRGFNNMTRPDSDVTPKGIAAANAAVDAFDEKFSNKEE